MPQFVRVKSVGDDFFYFILNFGVWPGVRKSFCKEA